MTLKGGVFRCETVILLQKPKTDEFNVSMFARATHQTTKCRPSQECVKQHNSVRLSLVFSSKAFQSCFESFLQLLGVFCGLFPQPTAQGKGVAITKAKVKNMRPAID